MASEDAPSSLLTPNQRDVLRDKSDIGARGERAAHARVRERIQAGLRDFQILFDSVDASKIVEGFEAEELTEVLRWQVAFIFRLSEEKGIDFDQVVFEGVDLARKGLVETLKSRFENGDSSLTAEEISILYYQGEITKEDQMEYLETVSEDLSAKDIWKASDELR